MPPSDPREDRLACPVCGLQHPLDGGDDPLKCIAALAAEVRLMRKWHESAAATLAKARRWTAVYK